MAKTYALEALWPLLGFRKPEPPLHAIAESGSISYVANAIGIWLVADLKGLTDQETQALTGLHPANLVSVQIEGVNGYAYGMLDGTPLLPLPFTAAELLRFEERTPEVISEHINRGDDTDAWIADLEKDNPDAAELARGIYGGQWPSDLADIAAPNEEGLAKEKARDQPSWSLNMPKRFQGYGKPLYDNLKAAHVAGKTRPTARNVLDDWKLNRPADVAEVSNDGLKYYDASGNTKPADLAALRKAIERMTA
jgi:hypothetical protein